MLFLPFVSKDCFSLFSSVFSLLWLQFHANVSFSCFECNTCKTSSTWCLHIFITLLIFLICFFSLVLWEFFSPRYLYFFLEICLSSGFTHLSIFWFYSSSNLSGRWVKAFSSIPAEALSKAFTHSKRYYCRSYFSSVKVYLILNLKDRIQNVFCQDDT